VTRYRQTGRHPGHHKGEDEQEQPARSGYQEGLDMEYVGRQHRHDAEEEDERADEVIPSRRIAQQAERSEFLDRQGCGDLPLAEDRFAGADSPLHRLHLTTGILAVLCSLFDVKQVVRHHEGSRQADDQVALGGGQIAPHEKVTLLCLGRGLALADVVVHDHIQQAQSLVRQNLPRVGVGVEKDLD